jgi:hypothetical protein
MDKVLGNPNAKWCGQWRCKHHEPLPASLSFSNSSQSIKK